MSFKFTKRKYKQQDDNSSMQDHNQQDKKVCGWSKSSRAKVHKATLLSGITYHKTKGEQVSVYAWAHTRSKQDYTGFQF